MSERLSYRFGPLERRGILGPVRAGQAATIAVGALLAIAILDRAATATGAALATITFGTLVLIALAPVGRRTAEEWAPVIVAFALRRLLRRSRFRSPLPTRGLFADERAAPRRRTIAEPRPEIPRELRGVSIAQIGYRDRSIGVIREQRGRRLTAVLACRVVAFSLLDPEAQERRLARWGLVLAGAAGTCVRRLQWIERTAPAQGDELARWLQSARDPAVPPRGHRDDRVLPRADRRDGEGHPGARDPGRGPGRRPPSRKRRRVHLGRTGRADRADRAGARGGRGDGARSAQRGPDRAHPAHRV